MPSVVMIKRMFGWLTPISIVEPPISSSEIITKLELLLTADSSTISDILTKQGSFPLSESNSVADSIVKNALLLVSETTIISDALSRKGLVNIGDQVIIVSDVLTKLAIMILSEPGISIADATLKFEKLLMGDTIVVMDVIISNTGGGAPGITMVFDIIPYASGQGMGG